MNVGFFVKLFTCLNEILAMNCQMGGTIAMEPELIMPNRNIVLRLLADEAGASAIEYGLILALIAVGLILSIQGLAQELNAVYTTAGTTMTGATS